jgi:Spy/CpxP family protein refolding chaperone
MGTFFIFALSNMVKEVKKMKNLFKKMVVAAAVFSMVLAPSLVLARDESQGPAEADYEELSSRNIAAELGLTEEQKELLKEQRYQAKYKRIETFNKIRLKELELRHELEKKEINEKTVRTIVDELKKLQGNMIEQRVDAVLSMKKILTPEQFEKLQARGRQKMRKGFFNRIKRFGCPSKESQ